MSKGHNDGVFTHPELIRIVSSANAGGKGVSRKATGAKTLVSETESVFSVVCIETEQNRVQNPCQNQHPSNSAAS